MKKRLLAIFTVMMLLMNLFIVLPAFGAEQAGASNPASVLNGKKVLFVGCSFTYYGGTVRCAGDLTTGINHEDYLQSQREYDNGFFYQLCKANGAEVNVTDWTFGGHNLNHILGGQECSYAAACRKGAPGGHLNYLTDRNYDYVILNEIRRDSDSPETIRDSIAGYMKLFTDANPNVKIYYIVHSGVYVGKYNENWLKSVEMIEELGATVLDWGTLIWDVAHGYRNVPGGTQDYRLNTFTVSREGDSYHPNILTGYLFSLMTYCAITGQSAVGQPYDFCYDENNNAYPISPRYEIETYKDAFYTYDNSATAADERDTNFDAVLKSSSDMNGLQQLADLYLDDETDAWKNHITPEPDVDDPTPEAPAQPKKILFMGESMMYYSGMVLPDTKGTNVSTYTYANRENDQGLFYQFCKQMGLDVNVVDWSYVSHSVTGHFFKNSACTSSYCSSKSPNHYAQLAAGGLDYDYVVFQEIKNTAITNAADMRDAMKDVLKVFTDANPNVKFYYMIHYSAADSSGRGYPNHWLESVAMIEDLGVTIIDSGTLVNDIITGAVTVPGATKTYNKNSFIVERSATDGYHPNILKGYLDTISIYCAITGTSATAIDYSKIIASYQALASADDRYNVIKNGAFYADKAGKYMKDKYSVTGTTTNFDAIMNSRADMAGLNQLIDTYLLNNAWLKYVKDSEGAYVVPHTITFNANDGSASPKTFTMYVASGGKIHDQPVFENTDATFIGWYNEETDAAWNFATDTVSKNVTLYAAWKEIDATVTKNGETYTVATRITNLDAGSTVIVAGYSGNTLRDISIKPYLAVNDTFTLTGDIDTIRVMVWKIGNLQAMYDDKLLQSTNWLQ